MAKRISSFYSIFTVEYGIQLYSDKYLTEVARLAFVQRGEDATGGWKIVSELPIDRGDYVWNDSEDAAMYAVALYNEYIAKC